MWTRKVGSSFWKRLRAREKLGVSAPTGLSASEMTGSGTNMFVCSGVSKPCEALYQCAYAP